VYNSTHTRQICGMIFLFVFVTAEPLYVCA